MERRGTYHTPDDCRNEPVQIAIFVKIDYPRSHIPKSFIRDGGTPFVGEQVNSLRIKIRRDRIQ